MEIDQTFSVGVGTTVPATDQSLLLQLRSDRRLGHEWDDWDGQPLPDGGVFQARASVFFGVALLGLTGLTAASLLVIWLISPRLAGLWPQSVWWLGGSAVGLSVAAFGWLAALALVLKTGQNWLPAPLAERGLLPWVMPGLEWLGRRVGLSRDRVGNASVRVFNRLAVARGTSGIAAADLLILVPRCLGKEGMQTAMAVSARYGVPLFVAARGRNARQMIAMRSPRGIVAVACERDLVSGIHDVAGRLPVLGTTLQLGDGPCRNTNFSASDLEANIRRMLGLEGAGSRA